MRTLENLPAETFNALRFHIGLDEATDHSDPGSYPARHALNPSVNGLRWGWAGGFLFLALEGHTKDDARFSYHLAGAANRMEITLPVALDLRQATTIELEFHVDQLIARPQTIEAQKSTHSRGGDSLAEQMAARAEQAFTIRSMYPTAPATAADRAPVCLTTTACPAIALNLARVAISRPTRSPRRESSPPALAANSPNATRCRFSISRGNRSSSGTAARRPCESRRSITIQNPIEMHARLSDVEDRLTGDKSYASDFAKAFGTPGVSAERIGIALEAFVLTLTSFDSKFDRAMRGEAELTEQEKRGFQLFATEYDPRQKPIRRRFASIATAARF